MLSFWQPYLCKYNVNGLSIYLSTSPIQPYFFFKSENEKYNWKDMWKNHIKLLKFLGQENAENLHLKLNLKWKKTSCLLVCFQNRWKYLEVPHSFPPRPGEYLSDSMTPSILLRNV